VPAGTRLKGATLKLETYITGSRKAACLDCIM